MRTLQLAKFAKARISRESGLSAFRAEGVLARDTPADDRQRPRCFVGVEALVPRGARADYGMLGVAYDPDHSGQLRVTAGFCDPQGERWRESLAASIDDVRIGLPKEYSEAVFEGLLAGLRQPPSGSLTVEEAAHGLVGSSSAFFRNLARAAGELMFLDESEIADDALAERLRGLLVGT